MSYFQFKRQRAHEDLKNEMMILDMAEIKEEKGSQLEASCKNTEKEQKTNKVRDLYKKKRKRESNLVQLLSTAEEGKEISKRLWKKLDKETKNRTVGISKFEFNQFDT